VLALDLDGAGRRARRRRLCFVGFCVVEEAIANARQADVGELKLEISQNILIPLYNDFTLKLILKLALYVTTWG